MDSEQSGQKHGKASHNFPRTAGTASRKRCCTERCCPESSTFLSVRAPAGFLVEGGRVSVPLLIPALVLPEDTLADTHLKKPANAVESSVSRDTTLSVSCFKCSWPALGPTAQAMMDRIPGRESLLPLHRTPGHQKGFHQSSGIPEDASLLLYHHLSDVHPVQHTASDIQGQHR